MSKNRLLGFLSRLAMVVGMCAAAPAFALPTLIGDTVTVEMKLDRFFPVQSDAGVVGTDSFQVVQGTAVGEFGYTPTFTSNTINLGFFTTFGAGGAFITQGHFAIRGIDAMILGVSFLQAGGLEPSVISFTDHEILLTFSDQSLRASAPIELSLTLADPQAVPEPGSLALLGLGLAGLAAVRRRRS